MRIFFFFLSCIFTLSLSAQGSHWIQFMPHDELWFRVTTEKEECPKVIIDDNENQTLLYHDKTTEFPVISCYIPIMEDVQKLSFNNEDILLNKKIERILVIGDTGCRIKGTYTQDCKKQWHFKKIIDIAASRKPDLVIHLGDYLYREFCRLEDCKDEPVGDKLKTWNEDFFKPAKNLLSSIPWIFVRGNHESCARGGKGWSHFFDYRKRCVKNTQPYSIDVSHDLRFIIADSAETTPEQKEIDLVNFLSTNKKSWLFTHRPFWNRTDKEFEIYTTPEMLSQDISTIFSGHIHIFQVSDNSNKKQVIVGNSGTRLTKLPINPYTKQEFGFVILDKQDDGGWKMNLFNVEDIVIASYYIE